MTKALYRKWRPQNWDQVAAQEHVIQTLQNAVVHDRVAHAYLFAGPRGTGKTTTARLLAKAVNCQETDLAKRPCNACEYCLALNAGRFMDLIEIDAASNTSVEDVRDLRDKINFSPSQGAFKVYIIDEVHMLSTAAFNALLKTLEEPPPHAIFILATTEIHKIPATVLSRCQRHEFRRIPLSMIIDHLKAKSKDEDIHVDDAVFTEIARQATGSMRDAISLLDQLTSSNENVTLEIAQKVLGTATSMLVIEIVNALIEKDASTGLTHINQALDSGTDPRQLARQVVTYLRNILLYKMGNSSQVDVPGEVRARLDEHASCLSMPDLLGAIEAFNQATIEEHANWHPGLGLELAFTHFLIETDLPEPIQPTESKVSEQVTKTRPQAQPAREPRKEPVSERIKPTPAKSTPSPEKTTLNDKILAEKPSPSKQKTTKGKPSSPEPVADDLSINAIQASWVKIKSMVGKHNPRTEGLLNSVRMTNIKDKTLILGFSSQTLRDMMEKEGNINLTTDILEEVFGEPMSIKCIVTSQEVNMVPEDLDIEKDGMVSTATRDLGGKISSAEEES